jgi:hypothetical protein
MRKRLQSICGVVWLGMNEYISKLDIKLVTLLNHKFGEGNDNWTNVIQGLRSKVQEAGRVIDKFTEDFALNPYGAFSWGSKVMGDSARVYCIDWMVSVMLNMADNPEIMVNKLSEFYVEDSDGKTFFDLGAWMKMAAKTNLVSHINSSSSNVSNEMERVKHNTWVEFAQGFWY